jgi:phosphoglycolate phosphatase
MSNWVVREAQDHDSEPLFQILDSIFEELLDCSFPRSEAHELNQPATAYANTGGACWVVEQDRRVVGFASCRPLAQGDGWELHKLYLLPEARKQGLGRRLVALVESFVRSHGSSRVQLFTDTRLKIAHNVYPRLGYQLQATTKVLENQTEDSIFIRTLYQAHRPTVFLFDIDGTLVNTKGAGRRAMERAFELVAGRRNAVENLVFAGMTDRAIARLGLATVFPTVTEERIDQLLAAYLAALTEELSATSDSVIYPGCESLLAWIQTQPEVAIGLGTGNVRDGAMRKLEAVGLEHHFSFGGFGCDAENRAELLRHGAMRGAAKLAKTLEECRTVVIGDTPKDIAAAREIGAECLAVGTGRYSVSELLMAGACAAVPDLEHQATRPFLKNYVSSDS